MAIAQFQCLYFVHNHGCFNTFSRILLPYVLNIYVNDYMITAPLHECVVVRKHHESANGGRIVGIGHEVAAEGGRSPDARIGHEVATEGGRSPDAI